MTTAPLVERVRGSAVELHARTVPADPVLTVWAFDVDSPAIALGSRQGVDTVDAVACTREGVEIVRRRSGGGVVLLVPGEIVWVDVVVPAGHPTWSDDVTASMLRMGERWCAALDGLVDDALGVHRGALERTPWSELVCFAGVGPGEVLASGRKLVGISQRRTRGWARFQCAVHRRFRPERTVSLLAGPLPDGDVPDVVAELAPHVEVDTVVTRLADALATA